MKITALLTVTLVGAASAADTLYLVNSWKGNEISSGMAYYADGHDATGGTGGSRPDDYVDVTHGSHIIWEGQPVKGKFLCFNLERRHELRIRYLWHRRVFHIEYLCGCGQQA